MSNFESIKKRIKNLKQNKDKPEEEINILAKEQFEREEILGSLTFCVNDDERKFASELLQQYLKEGSIETTVDKDTLRQLIDLEIVIERVKLLLNIEYQKVNRAIPLQMLDQMASLNDQIMSLKERLGLVQKKGEKKDSSHVIEDLKERFHKWINRPENRSNFEVACSSCGEIMLIRRRLDKEKDEVVSHPWFIDGGILFNKQIFIDLELKKISIDQAARYLNASQDYIQWIQLNYPIDKDKSEVEEEKSE